MHSENIYGLFDFRKPSIIMYVGKGGKKRACSHWQIFIRNGTACNAFLRRWLGKLRSDGVEPTGRFLEENVTDWENAERSWISRLREINPELCNVASGGNGYHSFAGSQLGGRNVHKLYPRLACENVQKVLTALHAAKDGEGKSIFARKLGKRVHELHPGMARINGLRNGSLTGLRNNHVRWHVARGRVNPACKLCREGRSCS
jgi:hypothetical protein